jgi:hypothetical protein
MKKMTTVLAAMLLALSMMAMPAMANHTPDITITSPSDSTLSAGTTEVTIGGTVVSNARVRVYVAVGQNPETLVYDSDTNVTNDVWSFLYTGLVNGETYAVRATATHSEKVGQATTTFSVATPQTQKDGPDSKDECDADGWVGFGFKNHGQCVRYVAAGKDSR